MTRYRYVNPTKRGRWHDTKEAAEDAAVKAGEGHRDDWGQRRFYPSVLTRIEIDET
ncbi:hypothetical protein [Sphingobium sp. CECT 9361]|uniref:hypothetical protein n=1 Tax=Sphingobium sp. CECT 9361 TaxID=2845384 RepID=UPI001E2FAA4A|nr:hypothetical protein [Sphingobium sp. CECT 9361]